MVRRRGKKAQLTREVRRPVPAFSGVSEGFPIVVFSSPLPQHPSSFCCPPHTAASSSAPPLLPPSFSASAVPPVVSVSGKEEKKILLINYNILRDFNHIYN